MAGPLAGKRIGLLTAAASRLGGGVFEAVLIQAAMIRELGGEAVILALKDRYVDEDAQRFGASPVISVPVIGPAQIGFAPRLLDQILAQDLDCLHLNGIWMYPSRAAHLWARRTGRPYIVSTHGMLNPWITARGRWKKALARRGYERASWRAATILHALTAVEAQNITAETGRGDIAIVPNPAPDPGFPPTVPDAPRVIYIGRIHPSKNLMALIEGWRCAARPDDAKLILAGWGDPAHVAALRAAVEAAGPSVAFIGPIYGADKQELLASARYTVLPSLTEGLPMAVLEGWAAGVPTIMTEGCNLPEGFSEGAAIDCGYDADAIGAALSRGLGHDSSTWLGMARAAQRLAATRYSRRTVASQWIAIYNGERDAAAIPPC